MIKIIQKEQIQGLKKEFQSLKNLNNSFYSNNIKNRFLNNQIPLKKINNNKFIMMGQVIQVIINQLLK